MKFLLSCALTGVSWCCLAQSTLPPLVSSGSLIAAGIQLHDEQKYNEALVKYQQVSRNDTNYTWALVESALTYTSLKQYDKAIAAAQEGLRYPSAHALDLSLKLGNAYDEAGQPEKAMAVYDQALTRFPHSHQLLYERGVTLIRLKRTAEAIQSLQRAIDASFFHASSHYLLGVLCGENGYPVQSMLSLMTFLMMSPDSERSAPALLFLEKITTEDKTLTQASQPVGMTDAFPEITRLVRSRLALQDQYAFKSKLHYKFIKQVQLVLEKLPANAPANDFWGRTYAASYHRLWEADLFEPFTYYTLPSIDKQAQQKYQKDDKDIRRFREWASAEFNRVNAYKKDVLNGKEILCHHSYYKGGALEYLGAQYDEKTKKVSGDFESYYPTGGLRSKGQYTSEEKKTGEWHFYYPNGELDQTEQYTTSGSEMNFQAFYANGNLRSKGRYTGGMRNGPTLGYSAAGARTFEGDYLNNQWNGRIRSFYPDETPREEGTYANGVQDGPYRNYHPNGVLSQEGAFRSGKEHGPFRAYAKNGKLIAEGKMVDGQMEGEWKWYHPNGKLSKAGNYRAGKEEGAWKVYHDNGTLSEEFTQVAGKVEGIAKVYDTDGKLYFEYEYKGGRVRKYRYFDKQGKVVGEESARGSKLHWVTHYPSGAIEQEGNLVDGEAEGPWKLYHETGYLLRENAYQQGKQEGTEKIFHADGKIFLEQTYRQGELEGLQRRYFQNGQLAAEGWFAGGNRQGEWRAYYVNGKLKERNYYLNDEPAGYQEYYHPDGKKYHETVYREGVITQEIQYDTLGTVLHQVDIRQGNGPVELKHLNGKTMQRFVMHFGQKEGEETIFYPTGKLKERAHYRFQRLHGPFQEYYPNGKPRIEAFYKLGEQDSTYRTYNEKGQPELLLNYADGKKEGTFRWIYPNGKTEIEGNEQDDEREGYFTYYAEDGSPEVRLFYHKNSILRYSYPDAAGQWKEDIVLPSGCGKIKAFYQSGKPSFEMEVLKGERHGIQRFYYPNGQVRSEKTFVNGEVHGEVKEFYANGHPKKVEQYFYDTRNGLCQEYREDGTLFREVTYLIDLKHGWEREFDKARKVVAKRKYVYNEPYE